MSECFNYVLANIACVVLMGTVLFNVERSVDKQISTVILARMMRLLVIYFLVDSVWMLCESAVFVVNRTTFYILSIIPYLCLVTSSWLWYMYCEIVQGNTIILSHKGTFISILPFYAAVIILIIGLFTDYLIIIDETGYQEYGPLYAVLLCVPFGYLGYSSIKAFTRAYNQNRYYDHSLYIAMGLFPIMPIICGLLQSFFLRVPILCYGATGAILFLYITATENRITTDALTQINNRQELQRYLSLKMRSPAKDMDLYLMMLDVDYFKNINDKFGHIEGDKALVTVAEAMKTSFLDFKNRPFLCRFGGDEFIVVLEAENELMVQEKADMIRNNVTELNEKSGAAFSLSICVGYAKYDYNNPTTIPQFIAMADEKLYEMKKQRKK